MTDGLRARESSWGKEHVLQTSVYTVTPLVEGVVVFAVEFYKANDTNFPANNLRNAYVVVRGTCPGTM